MWFAGPFFTLYFDLDMEYSMAFWCGYCWAGKNPIMAGSPITGGHWANIIASVV